MSVIPVPAGRHQAGPTPRRSGAADSRWTGWQPDACSGRSLKPAVSPRLPRGWRRSGQDFIKPGVQHPSRRFGHHMRGQRHNARSLRCSGGAQALGRLRPIQFGHAQVHLDQVLPGPCCQGHGLDPVRILVNPAAGDPNDICCRGSKTRASNPARQHTPQNRQSAALASGRLVRSSGSLLSDRIWV
jgi:hypothetical protein